MILQRGCGVSLIAFILLRIFGLSAQQNRGPQIRQTSGPRMVVLVGKDKVKLQCNVKYAQNYNWYKDGVWISQTFSDRYFVEVNRFLAISSVEKADGGLFYCVTSNSKQFANCSIELKVADPTVPPGNATGEKPRFIFLKRMESVKTEHDEGDRFELTCEAEGTPFPVVTWYKDGVIYTGRQQSGHLITPGGIDFRIDFNRVDIQDQGTYVCNVSNTYGWLNHSYKIDVKQQYPPQFGERPKLQYNTEAGNVIRLRCLVKGNPPPTVAWIKDQKLVQLSSRIRLNSRGNSVLRIARTQPDDAGNYTCTATNVLGKINATLELHVHEDLLPSFTGLRYLEKSYRAWPASHSVKFKCEAVGAPPLRYKWLKDGHRLLSRLCYLKLKDLVPDDSGDYTCIVTNPYGSINRTYTFNVVAKPRSKPILLNGLPRNTTAKVGDNTTMTCIILVSGTLPDFRWLKWGKSITSQPKMNESLKDNEAVYKLIDPHYYETIRVSESYGVQLNINNVSDDDFGLYTCYVSNHIGFDYNGALLIKYEEPSSPSETTTTQPGSSAPLTIVPPKNLTADKTSVVLVLGFAAVAVLLIVGAAIIVYRRRKMQLQNFKSPVDADKLQINSIFDQHSNYCSNPKLLNYEVPRNTMEFIEELEQGNALLFEYDAFIIYSSMDEEWVRGTLLPTLEDKYGFKCCIHYRDFMPGVLYQQNMVNSVYASKKTVAVVSKNFFKSGFCESEFEYALLRLAERRDDSLIVIKLDDIDTRKLPLEVRKRSYIDCPKSIEKETWETKLVKSLNSKTR